MMTELLLKYINGDCSEDEKIKVVEWLDDSPENMKEYLNLRKLNDFTIWNSIEKTRPSKQLNSKPSSRKIRKLYTELIKIAAVFFVAALVFRFLIPGEVSESKDIAMQTLHVPAGQRAELSLADGTKVWLNANTTFIFPTQFADRQRRVEIDGEGYFEVTPDKKNPFFVKSPRFSVKVWGTKFNLDSYSNEGNFETALFEGSVEVKNAANKPGVFLKPNEEISLENNQLVLGAIKNPDEFLWREGILSFDDLTLKELVVKLERYFDVDIQVKNPEILDYRYTGKFRMESGIDHILKVLQFKNRFEYRIDENHNQIWIE